MTELTKSYTILKGRHARGVRGSKEPVLGPGDNVNLTLTQAAVWAKKGRISSFHTPVIAQAVDDLSILPEKNALLLVKKLSGDELAEARSREEDGKGRARVLNAITARQDAE